jgi:pimeloyl-ACP methyl ester carboxylesterase
MLTLPIPILNMLLLATLFGVAPRLIKGLSDKDPVPGAAAIGALLLGLLGYAFASSSLNAKRNPLNWAMYPLVVAVPLAGIAYWAAYTDSRHIVLSVEGLLVGSSVLYFSVISYDDVRDGAKEVAFWLWLFWVGALAWSWICGPADSVQQATLWTMQIVLAALRISWFLLFLFSFAALVLGLWACWGIDKTVEKERRARTQAAVRTSRFALAMPTLGILIVTLALWSALFVKTAAKNGQYGNSIAAALFGDSIKELRSGPRLLHPFFLNGETVKRYLGQIPTPFTVNTGVVSAPAPVTISAAYKGDSQTTTLTVNPAAINLNVNPTTVTGGTPSTGTVTLNGPVPASGATVALSSSNRAVATVPENVTVTQGSSGASLQAVAQPGTTAAQSSSGGSASLRPNDYFQGLMVWSATPGFPVALLLMFSGLFLLILWVLPSIFTEMNPPVRSGNLHSERMGNWLSRGLDSTKIVAGLNWCAAFVVLAVFAAFYGLVPPARLLSLTDWMQGVNHFFISGTAAILEYMGLAAGSLSILAALTGSGSPALGIILDVDNYLRTSPKDETPRARIMERYVSLLRYLSEYKDLDGIGYDRVVIVAHSLGALISADLLRFLKAQRDPHLRRFYFDDATPAPDQLKIQLRLFTMGNPLRQLLNRFFPYLYEWVHPVPDNSLCPLKQVKRTTPPGITAGALPDPNLLGVERWLSAYRSGDYVGRSLWLDEWYDRDVPAKPGDVYTAAENPPGRREEMCIGAGAHQHYWDQSAPDIAEKLDVLIKP